MYKIAVVDDEYVEVERIKNLLAEYSLRENVEFDVCSFSCGDDFLKCDNADFDIVFFDIEMPGRNGLETAKELRKINQSIIIIFCTNLVEYAVNGYEVNALGYLVKPISAYSFNTNVSKACNILARRVSQKISIKTVHGHVVVSAEDIVYVEVQRHNLFFYIKNKSGFENIKTRGSMAEICDKLDSNNFVRCSASYLINLHHVQSIENNFVYMYDTSITVSRTYKKSFSDSFMKYLIENEVINI